MCGYKFRRQFSVDKYILDFYCPILKLAIEVDGISHESEEQRHYDIKRQRYIERFGIIFIRIKDEDIVQNLDKVVENIKGAIKKIDYSVKRS